MRGAVAWTGWAVAPFVVLRITPAAQAPPVLRVEPWRALELPDFYRRIDAANHALHPAGAAGP